MKRALGFAYLALIVLGLIHTLSPRLEAQNRIWNRNNQPLDGACFYLEANYRGEQFCVNSNESQRNIGERYNDRISSIRIFGRAEVTVYDDENFNGSRQTFRQDVPNLRDWNDRLSSFQVTGGQYGGQYGGRGRGNEPQNGACFYLEADYRGEQFCVNSNESQRNIGERYNDRISSIRIFGRAEVTVYDDENFNGSRQTFRQDVPNLHGWNDRMSSFQVTGGQYGGQYGGRGRGNEPQNGACFYLEADYRGEQFCVNSNESQRNIGERYNDRISSIRIIGRAEVTVYDDENFNGLRQTFRQDVPNLRDWNDRLSSFQVTGGQYGEQYGGRGRGNEPQNGACFYLEADYRGEQFCVNSNESQRNLGERYNDKISSIRVFGRARVVVYENENFSGASRTFTGDVSNLRNFNDIITSIEVR